MHRVGRLRRQAAAAAAILVVVGFVGPVLLAVALRVDNGVVRVRQVDELLQRFRADDYRLQAVAAGEARVPRLFVARLPRDWGEFEDARARKRAFLELMLPLVLHANARLLEDRARLLRLQARQTRGDELARHELRWLQRLAGRYRAGSAKPAVLLRHVDAVPPSLALAQAAVESGWGTSRFARRANALFGQWTWEEDGGGVVPRARAAGARHRVRAFDSLAESVAAYMRNLNSHPAYAGFRERRAALRAAGEPLGGVALARTMARYSQRGEAYVGELIALIRANGLARLDHARLRQPGAV